MWSVVLWGALEVKEGCVYLLTVCVDRLGIGLVFAQMELETNSKLFCVDRMLLLKTD